MFPAEVVIEERQRERGAVVLDSLAIRIRQASKAAVKHPDGEVASLDVGRCLIWPTGANVSGVRYGELADDKTPSQSKQE